MAFSPKTFSALLFLAGCGADGASNLTGSTGGANTPVSPMPTGTATYIGKLTSVNDYSDFSSGGATYSNNVKSLTADYTMIANFDARSLTASATNLVVTDTATATLGLNSLDVVDVVRYAGAASGAGSIGNDNGSISFQTKLSGTFAPATATSNGVALTPAAVAGLSSHTFTDLPVSGLFTGANASGIYGQSSETFTPVNPGDLASSVNTVTGTKR